MTTPGPGPAQRRAGRGARQLVGWVGVSAHVLLGLPTATLGLVVPALAHLLLGLLWVAFAVAVLRLRARRPLVALVVPMVYVLLVVSVVTAGEALLDWTA